MIPIVVVDTNNICIMQGTMKPIGVSAGDELHLHVEDGIHVFRVIKTQRHFKPVEKGAEAVIEASSFTVIVVEVV